MNLLKTLRHAVLGAIEEIGLDELKKSSMFISNRHHDMPGDVLVDFTKPVEWDSPEEWWLEQRAFYWDAGWSEEQTRTLINDLWRQYCFAAQPKEKRGEI